MIKNLSSYRPYIVLSVDISPWLRGLSHGADIDTVGSGVRLF